MALSSVRVDAGLSSNVTFVMRLTILDNSRDSLPTLLSNTTGRSDQVGWRPKAYVMRWGTGIGYQLVGENECTRLIANRFRGFGNGEAHAALDAVALKKCGYGLAIAPRCREQQDAMLAARRY
jgi:hypothetical protein